MRRLALTLAILGSLILPAASPAATLVPKWSDRSVPIQKRVHSRAYWQRLGLRHPYARRHWHSTRQWALNAYNRANQPTGVTPGPAPQAVGSPFPYGRFSPPTPGPVAFQGATNTADFVIGTAQGLIDGCGVAVLDPSGAQVGVYIDDTVNRPDSDPTNQRNCVAHFRALGWGPGGRGPIIAGISMGHPDWFFEAQGATWSAYEWYPHCHGLNDAFGVTWRLPARNAYIVQWNFNWSDDPNYADKTCTPPSQADHDRTGADLATSNQSVAIQLVLYY